MLTVIRRYLFERMPIVWFRDTLRMRRLVGDFEKKWSATQGVSHVAVVVTPWCGSAVPWLSLVSGLFLAANGDRVTFIVDDMPFGSMGLGWRFQLACIRAVLRKLHGRHDVLSLREYQSDAVLTELEQRSVTRLATLNVVWAQRGESRIAASDVEQTRRQIISSHAAIDCLIQSKHLDLLFVPGGVWGSSGIWVELANAVGIRVATYDSGSYGTLLLAVSGIACQLQDIPRAFSMLKEKSGSPEARAFVIESALVEINNRRSGVDKFSSQVKGERAKDSRFTGAVLIALNSPWDSAALGLHTVFDSTQEWIVGTVRYLLDNTDVPVVVRQHPVERLDIARSNDDYKVLLAQHFGNNPRLHFVAAGDPVNSYDLLDQVAAVVAYTSTIGIEAAALGKPVVTESCSYYSDLTFVRRATSFEQYHDFLCSAVSGQFGVSQEMREDALICYYLTQCCNWIFTPFNVPAFHEWSRISLEQLSKEESVRTIIRALKEDVPVAFLNHITRLQRYQAASESA